jgi:ParB family chromosome partitioning protein
MARKALGKGLDALIPGAGDEQPSTAAGKEKPGRPGQAGQVTSVRLKEISPNPLQPRKEFEREALEELAASIKQKGVLQPVLLRPAREGEGYELVAGERRYRAAQLAGLRTIPAIVYRIESDEEMLELALVENVQREDLNAMDTAEAYHRLSDDIGLTQEEIAERVGKSRTSVANTLRLLSLPRNIQELVREGQLSEGHARALLGLSSKAEQARLAKRIISRGLTVRDVERIVREMGEGDSKGPGRKGKSTLSPRLQAIVEEMQRALGTKVVLSGSESKGSLKIEYYSGDDLTRICDRLDIEID